MCNFWDEGLPSGVLLMLYCCYFSLNDAPHHWKVMCKQVIIHYRIVTRFCISCQQNTGNVYYVLIMLGLEQGSWKGHIKYMAQWWEPGKIFNIKFKYIRDINEWAQIPRISASTNTQYRNNVHNRTSVPLPQHHSSTCVQLGQRLLGGQRLVVGHIWARIWRSLVWRIIQRNAARKHRFAVNKLSNINQY